MDIFLLIISFTFMIIGVIGSIVPVLPGPLSSWIGLFIFSNVTDVVVSGKLILICLIIAIGIFILDYIIPIYTSKKFGASRYGIIGASIGIILGLFFAPFGIFVGAIIGSVTGEMILNKNFKKSLKSAFGVFLGFIISGFTKSMITVIYLVLYIKLFLDNLSNIF
jgi:uncharacterized protein YqgC (DUF456 family)